MALATGITAGIGAAGNLYKAIDGGIKAAKAKKEAEAAKQKLEKNKVSVPLLFFLFVKCFLVS